MKTEKVSGQTLFELLITLGVAVLITTGILVIITLAVRNASFSKNQSTATRYAQEGLEWIRTQRDASWDLVSTRADNTWCFPTLTWPATPGPCSDTDKITDTIFTREVQLTLTAVDTLEVLVTVSWTDATGEHSSRLNTRLTNWRSP